MTKRLAMMCLVAMLVISLAVPAVRAQDGASEADALERLPLKDIKALYVSVDKLPDRAKVMGLSKDSIQTDVELKLRLAGLHVATVHEWYLLPGMTELSVEVTMMDDGRAAFIEVKLHENAVLNRNQQEVIGASTWSRGMLVTFPTAQVTRDKVKDLVDKFLNDWLVVNPKK